MRVCAEYVSDDSPVSIEDPNCPHLHWHHNAKEVMPRILSLSLSWYWTSGGSSWKFTNSSRSIVFTMTEDA